jgi:hypothetical protein
VEADLFPFGGVKRAGLVPDEIGDGDSAEVVEPARDPQLVDHRALVPGRLGGGGGDHADTVGVGRRPHRLQVDGSCERLGVGGDDGRGDDAVGARFAVEEQVPHRGGAQPIEDLARVRAERVDEAGVEPAARPATGGGYRSVQSKAGEGDLERVGDGGQPREQRNFIALLLMGVALSVPPLEEILYRGDDRRWHADAACKRVTDIAFR